MCCVVSRRVAVWFPRVKMLGDEQACRAKAAAYEANSSAEWSRLRTHVKNMRAARQADAQAVESVEAMTREELEAEAQQDDRGSRLVRSAHDIRKNATELLQQVGKDISGRM